MNRWIIYLDLVAGVCAVFGSVAPQASLASVERALQQLLPPAEPRLEQRSTPASSVAKAYFNSFGVAK